MKIVLDACAVVALVVADDRQAAVQARVEGWLAAGDTLHAPSVLPYEIANVLARLVFDGDLDAAEIPGTWADLAALGVEIHPFDFAVDGPAVAQITVVLRRRHATDAAYVRLAQQLGARVWTIDGPFARGAAAAGLPVELIA